MGDAAELADIQGIMRLDGIAGKSEQQKWAAPWRRPDLLASKRYG
jgi:hypothetical protein